jgi:hypothetical protein
MRNKYWVIYHNDSDGACSAAIVLHYLLNEKNIPAQNITTIRMGYGDHIGWIQDIEVAEAAVVYMVDFSLPPEHMKRINEVAHRFVWIDHHKTAIDEINSSGLDIPGARGTENSASFLTWEWCYGMESEAIPYLVTLVDLWDTWKHKDETKQVRNNVMDFQTHFKAHNWWPHTPAGRSRWMVYFGDFADTWSETTGDISKILDEGSVLRAYQEQLENSSAKQMIFYGKFAGHTALMSFHGFHNSTPFERNFNVDKVKLMVPIRFHGSRGWTFSMYSTDPEMDCGALAKHIGANLAGQGGGHPGAAGFQAPYDALDLHTITDVFGLIEIEEMPNPLKRF